MENDKVSRLKRDLLIITLRRNISNFHFLTFVVTSCYKYVLIPKDLHQLFTQKNETEILQKYLTANCLKQFIRHCRIIVRS